MTSSSDTAATPATPATPGTPATPATTVTSIRVRYAECDPMGIAHHAAYPVWFEIGRTESLRAAGGRYRDLEDHGIHLAVVSLEIRYRRPARYDDVLELRTTLSQAAGATLEHRYELLRDGQLLTTAASRLACVDAAGRARRLPESLRT